MIIVREKRDLIAQEIFNKSYIVNESGCWIWSGKNTRGVPYIYADDKIINAKRFIFTKEIGEIFESIYTLGNSCDNNQCVNPNHLIIMTRTEKASIAFMKKTTASGVCNQCGLHRDYFRKTANGKKECPDCRKTRNKNRKRKGK